MKSMFTMLMAAVVAVGALVGCDAADEVDLGDDGPVATHRDGTGSDGDGDGGPGGDGSGDGSGDGESPALDDTAAVGAMGRALLTGRVPRATLEIDSADDVGLSEAAVRALVDALAEHGRKDVSHAGAGAPLPTQDAYTADDLRRIAREHRDSTSGGDTVAVHVLVLPGEFENSSATGVAFEAGSFAIFPDRLRSGLVQIGSPDRFETAVVIHELGHLFGLVNLTGEGGFHEDPDHPGHSDSRESVMFWAIEDVSIGNVFRGGPPMTFDDADRQEMTNLRQ